MIYAILGLKPPNEEEERESILTILDNYHNFEHYIFDNIEQIETLYLLEKEFWNNWCANVAFDENKSFLTKKEKLTVIDN